MHAHTREEAVVHILEGRFVFDAGGRERDVGPGDTVRIPAGVPHAFHNCAARAGHQLVLFAPAGPDALWAVGVPAQDRATPPDERVDVRRLAAAAQRHGLEIVRT